MLQWNHPKSVKFLHTHLLLCVVQKKKSIPGFINKNSQVLDVLVALNFLDSNGCQGILKKKYCKIGRK